MIPGDPGPNRITLNAAIPLFPLTQLRQGTNVPHTGEIIGLHQEFPLCSCQAVYRLDKIPLKQPHYKNYSLLIRWDVGGPLEHLRKGDSGL